MNIECHNVTSDELARYREISIGYCAKTRFRVDRSDRGLGGLPFVEENLSAEVWFDYDAQDEQGVFRWERRNLENWQIFYVVDSGIRVGGAVGARKTHDVNMLEDRDDLACLWDLRVSVEHRGTGIGRKLVDAAKEWATENGCIELKIETDTYNVPACRFYSAIGCELRTIRLNPDPDWPEEHQLLWYLELNPPAS
jgi:GNAT superfamily N-acetyltransferase